MTTINIKGPIISNGEKWIYNYFEEDSTCPKDVLDSLPGDYSDITVIINSGGGLVSQGNEIYTALKSYSGQVTIEIIEAASAASVIAMAGDVVKMSPVGQMMIHKVSATAYGNHKQMDKSSIILQKADAAIAAAYQLKTGLSREDILNMMDAETFMTAEEAKEKGFIDEIMFEKETAPRLVANCSDLIPETIIQKMQKFKQSGKFEKQNSLEPKIKKTKEDPMNPLQRFFF